MAPATVAAIVTIDGTGERYRAPDIASVSQRTKRSRVADRWNRWPGGAAALLRRPQGAGVEHLAIAALPGEQVIELEGRWLVLTSLRGESDVERLRAALAASTSTQLVDLKQISVDMLDRFRSHAVRQSALGALLIVALLAAGLRSFRRAARVVAPVAAALPVTMALLATMGQRIGVLHLVALLLVVGIGLNYALFFERPAADEEERGRTPLAAWPWPWPFAPRPR